MGDSSNSRTGDSQASGPTTVVWHPHAVDRAAREKSHGHRGCVLWFTGLSGSGKSTIANLVDQMLHAQGASTFVLDGDNIRHGLNATVDMLRPHGDAYAKRFGLSFSAEDREENIRRIGCVAELFADAGVIALTAFVSPYRRDRDAVRARVNATADAPRFLEVFVDTPLEVCERRDPKGLYQKARAGQIPNFTGISDPYEAPTTPEIHLKTAERSAEECARATIDKLAQYGVFLGNEKR